jgi:hypothetical protein
VRAIPVEMEMNVSNREVWRCDWEEHACLRSQYACSSNRASRKKTLLTSVKE